MYKNKFPLVSNVIEILYYNYGYLKNIKQLQTVLFILIMGFDNCHQFNIILSVFSLCFRKYLLGHIGSPKFTSI